MIDLHCHILPTLDDGAIDLEDSVAMARMAESDGIEIVCATPHIHPRHTVAVPELEGRVEAVNAELEEREIPVRVRRGGEIAEPIVDSLADEVLEALTLGGNGRWLLIEPRPGAIDSYLLDAVDRLDARGFECVVAHPERHAGVRFREHLEELTRRGALIQVTAELIAHGPASPTMLELAAEGLVHLLGSDAHSSHGGRAVKLSHGLERLREVDRVRPHIDWVAEYGPRAVISGERTAPPFAPVWP
jgi:protein-tyrosine phosphatase